MGNRALITLTSLVLLFLYQSRSFGAACCGGSSTAPLIMAKEMKSTVIFSLTKDSLTNSASNDGVTSRRSKEINSITDQLNVGAIYSLSPYLQIAGSFTYLSQHAVTKEAQESSSGLKNGTIQFNYEFLPEYFYSTWKPRGFIFSSLTTPLGKSIYEAKKTFQTDAISDGQYSLNSGLYFLKNWSRWDANFLISFSHFFSKDFESNDQTIQVGNYQNFISNIEVGFTPESSNSRIGILFNFSYQGKKEISDNPILNESYHLGLGLNGLYQFSKFNIGINYLDQSFFNVAKNKELSQTIGVLFNQSFY